MRARSESRQTTLGWVFRAVRVRLRFLGALMVAFGIVAGWDVWRTYWDRWTSPKVRDASMGAVSADTEYFCPMDPGVLSDWPGRCSVCQMALVRRPRGDMGPLPNGVVARVQLTPDRLFLGGISSEVIRYRPLSREIRSVGPVSRSAPNTPVILRFEVGFEEASWLPPGMPVEVAPDPPDGTASVTGRITRLESEPGGSTQVVVEVEVAEPSEAVRLSRFASMVARSLVANREPFCSEPQGTPVLREGDPRTFHACVDHPEILQVETGKCPKDQRPLDRVDLARNQRLSWWCPMHPRVEADRPGSRCEACGGMALVLRVVSHRPPGEVLAVPDSAVIDTGARTVVYLERMPGMFDAVEVRLGRRAGGFRPVSEGLEAGQRVASSGAFLIDAETRLNPSLAASYFGAQRPGAGASRPEAAPVAAGLTELSSADRALAQAQGTCPVTSKRLGSMGPPTRVVRAGRVVFLCCDGCLSRLPASPPVGPP